jgi:predicted kinase
MISSNELDKFKVFLSVGYPGSGKSFLLSQLLKFFGEDNGQVLSSDAIRLEVFNTTRYDEIGDEIVREQSKAAYEIMNKRAVELAKNEQKALLDATHLSTEKRLATIAYMLQELPSQEIAYIIVNTPHSLIEQRMSLRTELTPDGGTLFDAWQRVMEIFLADHAAGKLSWPKENEGIAILTADQVFRAIGDDSLG